MNSSMRLMAVALACVLLLWGVTGSQSTFTLGTTPGNPSSGKVRLWANSATGFMECLNSSGANCLAPTPVELTTGTSKTFSLPAGYYECTGACTITMPVPSAGVQYCVRNANNVSTVITFSAIGASAMYENTASTAYGTAGTGTLVSAGAVGDRICLVGKDTTHYDIWSFNGTWTAN